MKLKKWARLILAGAPLLSGCSGFWDVQSGSGGGGGTGTASGFFYVLNSQTMEVAGFSIATNATTLTKVPNSPVALGLLPSAAAISPNGGFLYVGSAAGGVFAFSINATTGELTILNNGNAISQDLATSLAVDPSGGWLLVGSSISGVGASVSAIPLDQAAGIVLANGAEQAAPTLPSGAVVKELTTTGASAPNPYVFVAMGASGIGVIPFNASSLGNPFGNLKVYSPKNSGGGDTTLAMDQTSQVLYVGETAAVSDANSNTGGLRMLVVGANSALTEASGSPYGSGGIGPSAILTTASYVYIANMTVHNSANGNITAFAISTTGGTATGLTAVTSGTIAAGVGTMGLAEDSTGTYVLAVNTGSSSSTSDLNVYTIQSTGALKSYATASTGTDPVQALAIVAKPK